MDSHLSNLIYFLDTIYDAILNLVNWQALVNVGAELVRSVPGRVSTEVDARLAYDTQGIIHKV